MVKEVKDVLPHIRALCKKHKIRKLWLFGSALDTHIFQPNSDVDFLYQFFPIESGREYLDHFYGFQRELEKLLQRKVDVIEYREFRNPYFREEVERTKMLIFEYGKEYEEISI